MSRYVPGRSVVQFDLDRSLSRLCSMVFVVLPSLTYVVYEPEFPSVRGSHRLVSLTCSQLCFSSPVISSLPDRIVGSISFVCRCVLPLYVVYISGACGGRYVRGWKATFSKQD
jgi:hypothetical protein